MKVGVLSDTHIKTEEELFKLSKIINTHFKDVDLLFHAGDLVSPEVLDLLTSFSKVFAVCGNMDPPELSAALPVKQTIEIDKFKIGLIHGWGPPFNLIDRIKKEFVDVNCIVFGHTHKPINEIIDHILFFNPGSPTDKVFASQNTIGILKIDEKFSGDIIKI